jgi:hypothetical protein
MKLPTKSGFGFELVFHPRLKYVVIHLFWWLQTEENLGGRDPVLADFSAQIRVDHNDSKKACEGYQTINRCCVCAYVLQKLWIKVSVVPFKILKSLVFIFLRDVFCSVASK